MKKTLLLLDCLFSFIWTTEVQESYDNYAEYIHKVENTNIYYTNYYYNDKLYRIIMPLYRNDMIKLEWLYMTGKMDEGDKYYKTVKLSILLTKLGMDPLYY